jgi:serine phosphatase RsbU (regulator of sigma subunit)
MSTIINEKPKKVPEETPHETLQEEYNKLYTDNKELLEGIYYAASVQQGLLPQERHFKRNFKDYFVYYRPLQIIGGDLYWVGQKNNTLYFAVADCTGHGVSGAMLSVLAVSFLNYVVLGKEHESLGEVLKEIDKKWIETFNFSGTDYLFDNDWMELSLGSFDRETRILKFAGANNNMLIAYQNEFITLRGNSYPIGGWQMEKERNYTEQHFVLKGEAMLYLSSDGYKDQFGGPNNKRLGRKKFIQLLSEIHLLSAQQQKAILEENFLRWKKNYQQTDDVCVMGLRL